MWVSEEKYKELEKRITDLEKIIQGLRREMAVETHVNRSELYLGLRKSKQHEHIPPEHNPFPFLTDNITHRNLTTIKKVPKVMRLTIMTAPDTYFHVFASLTNIEIPNSVILNMQQVPKFDMINEYCRTRYLLEHLRATKQKVFIVATYEEYEKVMEEISRSQWRDVFQL